MVSFKGYPVIIRTIYKTRIENSRIISKDSMIGGGILGSDHGWLLNHGRLLSDVYTTNDKGYHRYLINEKVKKIQGKSIIRFNYTNCYMGVFVPLYGCAMPLSQHYFTSIKKVNNDYIFDCVSDFIPIVDIDMIMYKSPYIEPILGNIYKNWLNEIFKTLTTSKQN